MCSAACEITKKFSSSAIGDGGFDMPQYTDSVMAIRREKGIIVGSGSQRMNVPLLLAARHVYREMTHIGVARQNIFHTFRRGIAAADGVNYVFCAAAAVLMAR